MLISLRSLLTLLITCVPLAYSFGQDCQLRQDKNPIDSLPTRSVGEQFDYVRYYMNQADTSTYIAVMDVVSDWNVYSQVGDSIRFTFANCPPVTLHCVQQSQSRYIVERLLYSKIDYYGLYFIGQVDKRDLARLATNEISKFDVFVSLRSPWPIKFKPKPITKSTYDIYNSGDRVQFTTKEKRRKYKKLIQESAQCALKIL